MLILPAEQKLDWRRPPYATLVLIFLNVLFFFQLQGQDNHLWSKAYQYYVEQELPQFEAQEYADFLLRVTNLGQDSRKELAREVNASVNAGEIDTLIPLMLSDRSFVDYMMANGADFIEPVAFASWQQQRMYLENNYLSQLSYRKMGLIPGETQLSDLISYQFLHGDIVHLIGNMVILFIAGFAIETILGKALYVMAYLTAGAVGGWIYALTEGNSLMPLVGASAAVSGLMGMYVTYYRLHKIRFFYFVVFYFNYFRAPALLVLPIWLGKEAFEYFTNEGSNIAYVAHAGGLLAGAAIMWPWVAWYHKNAAPEKTEEEADLEFREALAKGLKAINQVDFDKARSIFGKLHQHHPSNQEILQHLFHLYKLYPSDPESQHYTQATLEAALGRGDIDAAYSIWQEYQKYGADHPLPDHRYQFRLLTSCLNSGRLKEAETLLDNLHRHIDDQQLLLETYQIAMQTFAAREMPMKVKKYNQMCTEITDQGIPPILDG